MAAAAAAAAMMDSKLTSFASFHPYVVALSCLFLVVTSIVYLLLPKTTMPSSNNDKLKHAVITGGSSGIGYAMAVECLERRFETVTLIARNENKLSKVQLELQTQFPSSNIIVISADVTNYKDDLEPKLKQLVEKEGPPTLLINNAGTSSSGTFLNTPVEEFERLIKINYLGTVYTTKCLLPSMQNNASIVLVSSMAGQLGVYGYSAYSPSKAALILLGQTLQSEVRNQNISVTIAYPPDTDTPGFELENVGKPKETCMISQGGGFYAPQKVARRIIAASLKSNPPFSVEFGMEGWMLSTLTAGMSPVSSLTSAMTQVCLMGLLRFVSLFYLWDHARIVTNCYNDKLHKKTKKE